MFEKLVQKYGVRAELVGEVERLKGVQEQLIGGLQAAVENVRGGKTRASKKLGEQEREQAVEPLTRKMTLIRRQLRYTIERQEAELGKREVASLLERVEDPAQRLELEQMLSEFDARLKSIAAAHLEETVGRVVQARDRFGRHDGAQDLPENKARAALVAQQCNLLALQQVAGAPPGEATDTEKRRALMNRCLDGAQALLAERSEDETLVRQALELAEALGQARKLVAPWQPGEDLEHHVLELAARTQRHAQKVQTERIRAQEMRAQDDAVGAGVAALLKELRGADEPRLEEKLFGARLPPQDRSAERRSLLEAVPRLCQLWEKAGSMAALSDAIDKDMALTAALEWLGRRERNTVVQGYFLQVKGQPKEPQPAQQPARQPGKKALEESAGDASFESFYKEKTGGKALEEKAEAERRARLEMAWKKQATRSAPKKSSADELPHGEAAAERGAEAGGQRGGATPDVLVRDPGDDADDAAFFASTTSARGDFNDPGNLGKYVYQVSRLANILRGLDTGIAAEGLLPGRGGKPGGSVGITGDVETTYGKVSLQAASEVNSLEKVATTTNRKDGSRIYVEQREKHVAEAMDKAGAALTAAQSAAGRDDRENEARERREHDEQAALAAQGTAIMLRFPIRAEYLGKFNQDPIHLTRNLELLDGTPVPKDDIEVLQHGRWIPIVDETFLAGYREMFADMLRK